MADRWRIAAHAAGHFEEAAQTCGASEPPAWGWGKGACPSGTAGDAVCPSGSPSCFHRPRSFLRQPANCPPASSIRHRVEARTSARKGERHPSFVCATTFGRGGRCVGSARRDPRHCRRQEHQQHQQRDPKSEKRAKRPQNRPGIAPASPDADVGKKSQEIGKKKHSEFGAPGLRRFMAMLEEER